ncbi:hypothetical protein P152DRAFT_33596 [Eremomyces bilateralis CBS 781.70]|uniref:N-acetyltransferase domain-containing protein n=1 Tax=Eremomyces bilateralis CBS 781.70 TaxID=1392243 RepID=A0A6G1G372_9PEZI|nr:uncharacterized protein P152DRAFT_33596 [Eremomyces bilateralis CBS 781.70]KAF1812370.1 hypothetical protein P152DRAFT_33596 [Eremomyces bilateralis CBS 781.70]
MGLVVLPALIPDIEKIYDVYFSAFGNDEMGSIMVDVLFPSGVNAEFRKAHTAATLDWWHKNLVQYTVKCVDTDTGEIVGMGLGDLYLTERSEEERKNGGVPWLTGKERERAEAILDPLWAVKEKLLGGNRHMYCHVIGVTPEHQGRRGGVLLTEWGMELAERSGVPLYFESSPSTLAFYQKLGFETLSEKIVHKKELLGTENDIEVPLMVKMPSAAGGMTFEEWRAKGYPKGYK